jgi:hypothetical protein
MEKQRQAEEEARRKEEEEQRWASLLIPDQVILTSDQIARRGGTEARGGRKEKGRGETTAKGEGESELREIVQLAHSLNSLQAKKEQLRKEGKLLTAKQKADKQAAEIRRQALLQSGVKIEGLQSGGASAPVSKKVVYGNKKKKPAQNQKDTSTMAGSDRAPSPPDSAPATPAPGPASGLKDDWDASSADEAPAPDIKPSDDVKDDWDATSEEEEAPAKAAEPTKPASGKSGFTSWPLQLPQPRFSSSEICSLEGQGQCWSCKDFSAYQNPRYHKTSSWQGRSHQINCCSQYEEARRSRRIILRGRVRQFRRRI